MLRKQGFTHENKINKSVEWYTPPWIFEYLGVRFDLDPCSPEKDKVTWIPAENRYTIKDDGIKKDWFGRVWLNPPYGKHTSEWLRKMHLHRNGIALVFARTDCKWFHDYVVAADAILFLQGRVKFVDGDRLTKGSGAGSGSMLVAWGADNVVALKKFIAAGFLVHNRDIK